MPRRIRGGDDNTFGDLAQSAALVGVGAYAARNPNTPGMGIVANIGKFFLYAMVAVFAFFIFIIVYVLLFGKQVDAPATAEKLTMQCRPEDKPQDRNGQAGCITGSGNWYASSTS